MTPKKVVFVLGPPGVGKGTQCRKITEKYTFLHISAGELLRKEIQLGKAKERELIQSYIKDGKIVPAEITCELLKRSIENSPEEFFLIDGFPRNQENCERWNNIIGDRFAVLFVLFIDCPMEICVNRCLARGAAGNDRSDDTIDVLKKRVLTHIQETEPTINYFNLMNLVKIVDGNQTVTAVFDSIKKIFDSFNLPKR